MSLVLCLSLMLTVFVGCGKSETMQEPSKDVLKETETEPVNESEWPRTIVDATGKEIVLSEQPKRVTLLHSFYLEHFLALETPPTACAIGNGLGQSEPLEKSELFAPYLKDIEIIDLGSSREINLEAVLEAQPDVIVLFAGHKGLETILDQLNQIAPVIQLDASASWSEQLMAAAQVVGKEERAETLVKAIEGNIEKAKAAATNFSNRSFALFRTDGKGFIPRATQTYYETFGLTKPEGWPDGWDPLSLETVAEMNPYYIVFQHNHDASMAFVESMKENAVWQSLDAVKNGRVFYFDENMNSFGPLAFDLTARKIMDIYSGN